MNKYLHIIHAAFAIGVILLFSRCDDKLSDKVYKTSDQLTITSYLESNDSLSAFCQLLKNDKRDIILNTYGTYTMFVPTNNAMNAYLSGIDKSSVDNLEPEQSKNLIDYHIIMASGALSLKEMRNGIMPDTTVNGLNIFLDLSGGTNNITLNKRTRIIGTVTVSNGIVYIIDNVLDPPADNIFDYLDKSGKFNILADVFENTGLKDTLQKLKFPDPWSDLPDVFNYPSFTLFAESDAIFNANNITNYDALKQKVWEESNGTAANADEAMETFAYYHLVGGYKFIYLMYADQNLTTLAKNKTKVIHITGSPDFINTPPGFNDGISIIYDNSDKLVKNGVIHELTGILYPITTDPPPAPVTIECEFGLYYTYTSLGTKIIQVDCRYSNGLQRTDWNTRYSTSQYDGVGYARVFTPTDIGGYIEFIARNVTPATYNVFLSYRRDRFNGSSNVNVYFRNDTAAFNYKTQLLYPGLDMADSDDKLKEPEFNQNKKIGTVVIPNYGDYTFRFAHADLKYAAYDVIIMKPEN